MPFPPLDNSPSYSAFMGHTLEPILADMWSKVTGKKVFSPHCMFSKPGSVIQISADRIVEDENALLEIKTQSHYRADLWKNGRVPIEFFYQCQAQMSAFPEMEKVYIFATIGFQYPVMAEIPRDQSFIDKIKKNLINFGKIMYLQKSNHLQD